MSTPDVASLVNVPANAAALIAVHAHAISAVAVHAANHAERRYQEHKKLHAQHLMDEGAERMAKQ